MNDLPDKKANDRFRWHRLALKPCLVQLTEDESAKLLSQVEKLGLPEFFTFLRTNRLDQLWRDYLSSLKLPESFQPWQAMLRDQALQMAAQQLMERKYLAIIHGLFEAQNIPYFIFKGANLRYTLYQNLTLRSACDIDIFVPHAEKLQAVKCLLKEGFELLIKPENVSHEVSLHKDGIAIDLHWQLLRPGRTRIDLGEYLFTNREKFADGCWGLNHSASLLVMLVHPAFTKHLASPNSMLIHMVDLHRLLDIDPSGWNRVLELLDQSGMRTAGWSSLHVLLNYGGLEPAERLAKQIEPGALHRRYIRIWTDRDLIRRLFKHPRLVRSCFSLALQDSLKDAANAVKTLREEQGKEKMRVEELERIVAGVSNQPG